MCSGGSLPVFTPAPVAPPPFQRPLGGGGLVGGPGWGPRGGGGGEGSKKTTKKTRTSYSYILTLQYIVTNADKMKLPSGKLQFWEWKNLTVGAGTFCWKKDWINLSFALLQDSAFGL